MQPSDTTRANEPNWPQFHGPDGLGIAPDNQTYPTELDMSRNLLWKTEIPRGHSSPCIWEDRIFITASSGKKLETICIDRGNGEIKWRKSVEAEKLEKINGSNSHASSTPVCNEKGVFVHFGSFGLLAYDMNGNELWRKPLPLSNVAHGSGSSPIIANDMVIIQRDPDGPNFGGRRAEGEYILAVDQNSGETVWEQKRQMDSPGWSTPVLWKHGNEQELVVFGGGHIISYDLKDGNKRWWFENLPSMMGAALTPVYAGDMLFAAAAVGRSGDPVNPIELPDFKELLELYDNNKDNRIVPEEIPEDMALIYRRGSDAMGVRDSFAALDTDKDGALSENEWNTKVTDIKTTPPGQMDALVAIRSGGKGDISQSNLQWKAYEGIGQVSSPLFYQGRIYLVKHGGNVTCYNAKTGDKIYGERVGHRVYYFASPVAADDKIYFCSSNGTVIVVQAGDTFNVLAENKIGGRIYATPALLDGNIYLRTDKNMYAFHHTGQGPIETAELPQKPVAKEDILSKTKQAQAKTLHKAVSDGNIELIKSLISSGADVNEQNNWGWTPLYTAVAIDQGDIVKLLIDKGANVDTPSKEGVTPLHFAVNNGNMDIAKLLIKNGADCLKADKNGVTLLHTSAEQGNMDMVKLLVDNGAEIDAKDKWIWTPFFYACWKNDKELAEFFIEKGADINIKNQGGATPLHFALQRGNKELVNLLIDKGADINIKNNSGLTPLHIAALRGLKDIVERLLAKGADIKAQDNNIRTPIGFAKEFGHPEIAELLLEHANQSGDSKDIMTFYDYAAVGDMEQIKSLVSQGMDIKAKTQDDMTALHFAARNGHKDLAEYLISQGLEADAKNNSGYTPLLLATKYKDIVELLIDKGADIKATNNYSQTPLHLAASNGQKDVVELLIAKGADVNAKDRWNWTPLRWAQNRSHAEVVDLLKKHGAEE